MRVKMCMAPTLDRSVSSRKNKIPPVMTESQFHHSGVKNNIHLFKRNYRSFYWVTRRPKWNPIPYIAHCFRPEPPPGPCSKLVHFKREYGVTKRPVFIVVGDSSSRCANTASLLRSTHFLCRWLVHTGFTPTTTVDILATKREHLFSKIELIFAYNAQSCWNGRTK